jgi:hypothetical protein
MITKDSYKAMLEQAVRELTDALERQAELDTEREQLDARIHELKQGIIGLGPLCGISAQSRYSDLLPEYGLLPVGLKDGVLAVLGMIQGDAYITPITVRDNLANTGYEIKSKNILPSIHNVLKRLDGREVESADVNGKTGYRLLKKDRPAPPSPYGIGALRRITPDTTIRENTAILKTLSDIGSGKRQP